jgi:hypothetical protein
VWNTFSISIFMLAYLKYRSHSERTDYILEQNTA